MNLSLFQALIWIIYGQTCRNTYHYQYNNTKSTDCGGNGFPAAPANDVGGSKCCDACEYGSPVCDTSRVVCRCSNASQTCQLAGGVRPFWGSSCTSEYCHASGSCVQYYYCCSLKECASRTPDSSSELPCGSGCYKLPSGTKCVSSCSSNLYQGSSAGECTLKSCTLRIADGSATYPCGESTCYAQPNGGCSTSCPVSHYTTGSNGRCVLKPCSSRTVNGSATFTCGDSGCNEQLDVVCAAGCPSDHYTANALNGKCELAGCNARQVNSSAANPCGSSNCYRNANTSGCTDCQDSSLYKLNSGWCVLKDCSERTLSSVSTYYCGDRSCLYDERTMRCGTVCSVPEHYVANTTSGRCQLRGCSDRLMRATEMYPCGSADCEYNSNTGRCTSSSQSQNENDTGYYNNSNFNNNTNSNNNNNNTYIYGAGHTEKALGGVILIGLSVLCLLLI